MHFLSPQPGHLLCDISARRGLGSVGVVRTQHCNAALAFPIHNHFPEKPETGNNLLQTLNNNELPWNWNLLVSLIVEVDVNLLRSQMKLEQASPEQIWKKMCKLYKDHIFNSAQLNAKFRSVSTSLDVPESQF